MNRDNVDTAIEIDTFDLSEVDEKDPAPKDSKKLKKRLTNLNPAKAVIGGISQSANAVKGGISQSANVVKGGISQSANVVKGGISQMENVGGKLTKVPGISQGVSIFSDYRKFLDRGNVIDLAVAVVDSIVKDIIAPVVALASGKALEENFIILRKDHSFVNPDYSTREAVKASNALSWNYGNFIQTVINFFIISACVFLIVKLYQMGRNTKTAVTEKDCPYCAAKIAVIAVRCSECSSWLDLDEYAKTKDLKARRIQDGFSRIDSAQEELV
ncbi:hypothetical protein BGZ75_002767 [Mortierella antarctica]|nr:hypothetical protein BGZ75_002767 [Mortierella antarctica]